MKRWFQIGFGLASILLLLPGCSSNPPAGQGGSAASSPGGGIVGNASEDTKISQAVQAKLDAEPTLKAAGIKAKATGGQVELTGTVKALADKDKAEALADEAIKGFSSVNAGVLNSIAIADTGHDANAAGSAVPQTTGAPPGK